MLSSVCTARRRRRERPRARAAGRALTPSRPAGAGSSAPGEAGRGERTSTRATCARPPRSCCSSSVAAGCVGAASAQAGGARARTRSAAPLARACGSWGGGAAARLLHEQEDAVPPVVDAFLQLLQTQLRKVLRGRRRPRRAGVSGTRRAHGRAGGRGGCTCTVVLLSMMQKFSGSATESGISFAHASGSPERLVAVVPLLLLPRARGGGAATAGSRKLA